PIREKSFVLFVQKIRSLFNCLAARNTSNKLVVGIFLVQLTNCAVCTDTAASCALYNKCFKVISFVSIMSKPPLIRSNTKATSLFYSLLKLFSRKRLYL